MHDKRKQNEKGEVTFTEYKNISKEGRSMKKWEALEWISYEKTLYLGKNIVLRIDMGVDYLNK